MAACCLDWAQGQHRGRRTKLCSLSTAAAKRLTTTVFGKKQTSNERKYAVLPFKISPCVSLAACLSLIVYHHACHVMGVRGVLRTPRNGGMATMAKEACCRGIWVLQCAAAVLCLPLAKAAVARTISASWRLLQTQPRASLSDTILKWQLIMHIHSSVQRFQLVIFKNLKSFDLEYIFIKKSIRNQISNQFG